MWRGNLCKEVRTLRDSFILSLMKSGQSWTDGSRIARYELSVVIQGKLARLVLLDSSCHPSVLCTRMLSFLVGFVRAPLAWGYHDLLQGKVRESFPHLPFPTSLQLKIFSALIGVVRSEPYYFTPVHVYRKAKCSKEDRWFSWQVLLSFSWFLHIVSQRSCTSLFPPAKNIWERVLLSQQLCQNLCSLTLDPDNLI